MASTGKDPEEADADAARRLAHVATVRERFTALVHQPEHEIDLAEAALLIAAEEYPDLDVGAYLGKLDMLAQRVRRRRDDVVARAEVPDADEASLVALHSVLFKEEGFSGASPENYTDPRNSFLNDVLDRKRGLPITLSVLYCEVARRAGLEAVGINLPGHFIAQFRGRHLSVFIDPFHRGARLQPEDCAALAEQSTGRQLDLTREHLLPATPTRILARILENLKAVYLQPQRAQLLKALAVVERLLAISRSIEHVRDRGLLLEAMNVPGLAWFDLKLYAQLASGAPDAAAMQERADHLWKLLGRHN